MKLWLLRPIDEDADEGPWEPWFDKAFGFVIRAETEEDARAIAQADDGPETRNNTPAWTDPTLSSCVPLTAKGDAGIIISDAHWA